MSEEERVLADIVGELSPSERMALARTLMANRRTLLSYLKTAIALLASGYGLIALTGHDLLKALGVISVALAAGALLVGITTYRHMSRALSHIEPRHLAVAAESGLNGETASSADQA